jgi:hypothetical protein
LVVCLELNTVDQRGISRTDPAKQMKTDQYVVVGMSVVLLFGAFSTVMVTADEYDPATLVWMYLGIDVLMTVLLPILLVQIAKGAEPSGLKTRAVGAGVAGLVAGLVKRAARFSSGHGWWTGHLTYTL